ERKKAEQQAAEVAQPDPAENKEEVPEKTEPVKAQEGWGTFSFLDELFGAPQTDEEPAAETAESEESASETAEATEISEEPEVAEFPEMPETAEEPASEQEEIFETVEIEPAGDEAEASAEEIAIAGAAAGGIAAGLDILDEGKEKKDFYSKDHSIKEKKKGGVGRVLLVIVIILLIIELAVLGIKYLAPESSAAAFINEKMAQVVELFMNDEDLPTSGDVEQNADGENDVQQNQDSNTEADDAQINTTPSSDKNEVIINQAARNKNVESIKVNDTLKFDANADYADSGIKDSKALTNNILHKDADGTVYYVDQEVIGTLIAFDSGWIDYVNNKNKDVFNLLKSGSNAYNNCAAFNKDVTKKFKLLEIGEIRAAEAGYYVWAHEVIETTSGGKTTSDEFKWVYYMEAVDGNMQIVDYCRF
ncbi:MAG: hypothetical protein IJP24_06405, partial [Firmicutes bacterium]|nr:hypothetical protein [Bacillota bacterium]